jgi:DNA-binding CsgD family transcriptional regulator
MTRVGRLQPEGRQLLKLLSVIPERISRNDLSQLVDGANVGLEQIERRDLLEIGDELVGFRHDLIRRAVESSLTASERVALNRLVLEGLPYGTDPARLVHHAREADDIDRLIEFAPRAAAAALAVDSHREARDHFRLLTGYLDRVDPDKKGPLLDQWAIEEVIQGDLGLGIRVNEWARLHYREMGDRTGESLALTAAAYFHQRTGDRARAEVFANEALAVLGSSPAGNDVAGVLEVRCYMAMMAYDIDTTLDLAERIFEITDSEIDERIILRTLNHRGVALNILEYPSGSDSLDEAGRRAKAAGDLAEELRAYGNLADCALEARDLRTASKYLHKTLGQGNFNEETIESAYYLAILARLLDLQGRWVEAENLARGDFEHMHLAKMKTAPVYGAIDARRGRVTAREGVMQAWEMAVSMGEYQSLAPAASAIAEQAWISGDAGLPVADVKKVMEIGLDMSQLWSTGSIALWLWMLGELDETPEGIAEPYRLTIEGEPLAAAELWAEIGCPYDRAIALSHGGQSAQLEALEELDRLGADAVAAKLRRELREHGVSVPRRRSHRTKDDASDLTPRQTEVLSLLAERRSNVDIADQLFLSPRTVEHHVAAVMSKLDASTRDEAVEKAADRGILAPLIRP